SVDRLGRSLQDLVAFLSELHALKIDLFLRQQGLDTTTPAGKAMFQMLGVFAEFERTMIAERVRAGLARPGVKASGSGAPQLPPGLKREAGSLWRLLGAPVWASLQNGSESIQGQCGGPAALSSLQASSPPCRSQEFPVGLPLEARVCVAASAAREFRRGPP